MLSPSCRILYNVTQNSRAQNYYNAVSVLHYQGSASFAEQRHTFSIGLGNVLNNQTSAYNTQSQGQSEMLGSVIGAGAKIGASMMM